MSRVRLGAALALGLALTLTVSTDLAAQVKTQERSLMKFEGALGRVVGLFGGRAAREGIVNSVAVSGDRKSTMSDTSGQIIDLAEEKIYDIDVRGKSYKVTTFAEMRRQLEEARAKAEEEARKAEGRKEKEKPEEPRKEFEVDFAVKETGQRKTISGYDCRQVVTTITVREKGKTLEQAGGIVMTADSWMAPKIAALDEVLAFDRRYAEKLAGPTMMGQAEQMAMALAMWPGLQEAMGKYQAEGGNFDGTPISTVLTFSGVQSAEQAEAAAKEKEEERPSGVGGVLGGLGKRLAKKKPEEQQAKGGQTTIMTMTTEVLSVSTSVAPTDVAIPAGFKQK